MRNIGFGATALVLAVAGAGDHTAAGIGIVGEVVRDAAVLQTAAVAQSAGEAKVATRVVVGATLRAMIVDAFETTPLVGERSDAAGSNQAWAVVAAMAGRQRDGALEQGHWVGRESEFASLLEHWRTAREGRPTCVLLHGDAGIGKTALVSMLKQHLAAARATVIEVQCPQDAHFAQAGRRHASGMTGWMSASHTRGHADGRNASEPIWQLANELDDLLRDGTETEPSTGGALAGRVQQAAATRPLAIVIEDVQWADAATLSGLAALQQQLDVACPVLLLATSRTGPDSIGCHAGRWQTLALGRMSQDALERMLAAAPFGEALPEAARRRIVVLAEGIPHYALELGWMQAGAPARLTSGNHLMSGPNRLNAGLASRLDAVGSLKPLAQAAAVLGRRFDRRVLAALLEMDVRVLTSRLDMLVDHGLMAKVEGDANEEYRFSHALLWSAAYGSMLRSCRRRLHAAAATELINTFPVLAAAAPHTVAHQMVKAGNPGEAFQWWYKAAIFAQTGCATTVIAHINQALAAKAEAPQACTPLQEAQLMSMLGAQLSVLGGSASVECEVAYARAFALLSELPTGAVVLEERLQQDLRFDIQWGIAAIHMIHGQFDRAMVASAALIEDTRENGRDDLLLVALRVNGTAKLLSGRIGDAINLLGSVASLYQAERHGHLRFRYVSDQGIVGIAHLAWANAVSGDWPESLAAQRRALQLAGRLGHSHTSASVLGALAGAAQIRGDVAAATAFSRACHELSIEHGYQYWASRACLVSSWATAQRQPAEGLELIGNANARYRETGSGRAASYADYLEAEIALAAGQPRQALAALERAQAAGNLHSGKLYAAEFLRLRALALVAIDPRARATADKLLTEAAALSRAQGANAFTDRAMLARTNVLRRRRRPAVLAAVGVGSRE